MSRHESVGGRDRGHPVADAPDVSPDLPERTRIEQRVDAGSCVETTAILTFGQPFGSTHGAGGRPADLEIGEESIPVTHDEAAALTRARLAS